MPWLDFRGGAGCAVVTLIPTTIGALLSAIGSRMTGWCASMCCDVGRAVEAAGDVAPAA